MTRTTPRRLALLLGAGLLLGLLVGLAGTATALLRPDGLRIADGGWSTTGTAVGVPPGSLAVGSRLGEPSEAAYLRLAGRGDRLRLPVRAGRSVYPEDAALRLCRLSGPGWRTGSPGPAVPHDPSDCAPVALTGGAAVLDLSRWPEPTDRTGFALLPDLAGDAVPRTFRLVLEPPR